MQYRSMIFIILVLVLFATGCQNASNINLVTNSGFENLENTVPKAWNVQSYRNQPGVFKNVSVDSSEHFDGNTSFKIVNPQNDDARITQTLSVEENSIYRLSCFAKTSQVGTSQKGANISVIESTGASNDLRGTVSSWTLLEVYARTKTGQDSMKLSLGLGGYGSENIGTAWFDKVSVQKVDSVPQGAQLIDAYESNNAKKPYGNGILYYLTIYMIAFVLLILFVWKSVKSFKPNTEYLILALILVTGLILRIILASLTDGHPTDISCFTAWSVKAAESLSGLYSPGYFCDYPPVYLILLSFLGKFYSFVQGSTYSVIVRLPSIICDLIFAFIVYRLAKQRLKNIQPLIIATLCVFSPTLLLNSSIWAMMDSFLTLLIFAMLYFLLNKRFALAAIFITVAILTKPQGIFYAPVFLGVLLSELSVGKKAFLRSVLYSLSGFVGAFVVTVLPFASKFFEDPLWLFKLYVGTASTYPYITFNAYNLYALFGFNNAMTDDTLLGFFSYKTFGITFFAILSVCVVWFQYKTKKLEFVYLSAALMNVGAFVLLTRMHERYMFPALMLLVPAFIYLRNKWLAISLAISTITITWNMQDALHLIINKDSSLIPYDKPSLIICSALNTVMLCILIWTAFFYLIGKKDIIHEIPGATNKTKHKRR